MSGWDDEEPFCDYDPIDEELIGAAAWIGIALGTILFGGAWALWAWLW